MITGAIITGFVFFLTSIFSLFTVPAMPTPIMEALAWVSGNLLPVVNVARYALTPTFYTALFVIIIGLFTFDYVYGFIIWVLRKLPMLNIK